MTGVGIPIGGPDFAKKLYQMLQDTNHDMIVGWSDNGDSFVIKDMTKFTNDILPAYFKHSNFSSFVRQLNKYDFHKVKLSNEMKLKTPNVWEFKHPDFNRYNVNGLDNIKRKIPMKKENNSTTGNGVSISATYEPTGTSSSVGTSVATSSTALSGQVSVHHYKMLEDKVKMLENENSRLYDEFIRMRNYLEQQQKRFTTLINDQLASRDISNRLSSSVGIISKELSLQLGVQLPVLDLPHLEAPAVTNMKSELESQTLPQPEQAQNQRQPQQQQMQQMQQNKNEENDHSDDRISQEQRILNRPAGSGLHVLLVEDDSVCIQLCTKFLKKYGCTVVISRDGLSAISQVKRVKFDLVLMDIVMPNLDGASATSIIRSFDYDTPVIAMTGNYQREDLMTYLNHGMTDILAKPFSKEDLYMILEKHNIDRMFIHPSSNSDDNLVDVNSALGMSADSSNNNENNNNNNNINNNNAANGGGNNSNTQDLVGQDLMYPDDNDLDDPTIDESLYKRRRYN